MMAAWNDTRLDQLVRDAAPATRFGTDEEVTGLLRQLAADVASNQRQARTGLGGTLTRWRKLLIAPVAVGILAVTAAAGYAIWHDSDSAGFERAVDDHTARLELPPGTDRAAYAAQLRQQGRDKQVTLSDLATQSMAEHYGVCAWLTAWDRRHAAGDDAGQAQAVTALRRAIGAPAMTATDGGGVIANLREVAAAAARGDRRPVTRELQANCTAAGLDGIR
ncbi:hypothetical protein [Actinoplanes xinjiangensis]|uniref:hypothetical protein n=1 Tax=Actinoplanes xinjiangensis TaxID=512350 RepID=UPI003414BA14